MSDPVTLAIQYSENSSPLYSAAVPSMASQFHTLHIFSLSGYLVTRYFVRSVGDLVFDIVREVIAETLSGLFAR